MVRYRTPDRRPTKKRGFRTKRDAQDWAATTTVQMNTGTWRPAAAGKITVNEAAQTWLTAKSATVAPKTLTAYEQAVDRIKNIGTIGNVRLADVDHEVVEQWVTDMSTHTVRGGKRMSPKTIRNTFSVLSGVMKRAIRDKRIPSNPCVGVDLPKVTAGDKMILSPADVETMAASAGDYSDHINALAMAGLRWGELAGLQVQDVDLEKRRLRINRQITENKGKLIHGLPKHDKRRTVPIMEPLAAILEPRVTGKERAALVFPTSSGTAMRPGNARRDWFDPAAAAAGYPGLTPHELRHTFASVAISAGANVKALQQALGHHSAAFTLDEYGHLFPDDLDGFIAVMSARFTDGCAQNVPTNDEAGHESSEESDRDLR
ncbi:MAG: tyrosine-type recombinase/integrase [Propionibacteriaceae bacterium]|nr:tyrosine-type recombinase/integrase [Propionibacteriaceae bacterium]